MPFNAIFFLLILKKPRCLRGLKVELFGISEQVQNLIVC
nr:MAG TPA: hypothetical protein [Caudoviricetes sp.]